MSFDVEAATAAYIDGLGEEALAQAAAYTAGNQWLMLWGLLISAIVTLIIIRTGLLTKTADKLSKRGFVIRVFSISAVYLVLSELLELPWSVFAGWWRETDYGRTSQPLMDFLGQGLLALAISDSAFQAEIFRAGIQSIDRGQHEAAHSISLSYVDKMRFVILPQAIKRILPALGNQLVYMLKMSSLVSVIGMEELTRRANELVVTEYRPLEIYTVLVLEYLVLILVVSAAVRWFEMRMGAADKR